MSSNRPFAGWAMPVRGHMVVDGANIAGLPRRRFPETPPFPKWEGGYSNSAGKVFASRRFSCHDPHKRLHDLKGLRAACAPYDEGAVPPACRCCGAAPDTPHTPSLGVGRRTAVVQTPL